MTIDFKAEIPFLFEIEGFPEYFGIGYRKISSCRSFISRFQMYKKDGGTVINNA